MKVINYAVHISDCLVNWYDEKVLSHHPRVKSRKTLQSGYLVTWLRVASGIYLCLDLLLFEPGYPVSFYNIKGLILNGLLVSKSRSSLVLQVEVTDVTTLTRKLQKADERWSSSLRIWWGTCRTLNTKDQHVTQFSGTSWTENGRLTECNVRFSLKKLNDGKFKNAVRSTS